MRAVFFIFTLLEFISSTCLAQPMSYEVLKGIIKTNNITTVDQLIESLPLENRKNYTFVYESRSVQKENASPNFPRAIIYDKDANFVLTFTKDPQSEPKTNGADTVETLEWDKESASFKLRELVFNGKKNPLVPEPEVNPQKCLACHGKDPKPIWESYNVWPGVYGSVSRDNCDAIHADSKEAQFYKSFLTSGRLSPRYKDLPPEIKSNCAPEHINVSNAADTAPNHALNQALYLHNVKRVRRMIENAPKFKKLEYSTAAILLCPDIKASVENEVYTETKEEFSKLLARFNANNSGITNDKNSDKRPINFASEYRDRQNVAKLKMIAELLDLPWDSFSMSQESLHNFTAPLTVEVNYLSHLRPLFGPTTCVEALAKAKIEREECLKESELSKDITNLALDSDKIIRKLSSEKVLKTLQTCLACHNSEIQASGLELKLDSFEAFAEQLKKDPDLAKKIEGRMKGRDHKGAPARVMPPQGAFDVELQKLIMNEIQLLLHK